MVDNPLTAEELKAWEQETLNIILLLANRVIYQRECELINERVDYDPDSDPTDESRAIQRHERRRIRAGLPERGYRAVRTISGWALMKIAKGDENKGIQT